MKAHTLFLAFLLTLSFSIVFAQESPETNFQQPSQELLSAARLLEPAAGSRLDVANFPRFVSPQDFALTTGNLLFHFTDARFELTEAGPSTVIFILEGYVANYSNRDVELFDGDFRLYNEGNEYLPSENAMENLARTYRNSRDYPGRNVPLRERLTVPQNGVKFIFLAYRIPASIRNASLVLTYNDGNRSVMRFVMVPEDNDGTSPVSIFKLVVDEVSQYQILDPLMGEASENGLPNDIVPAVDYDNCGRDPNTFTYRSYTSSGVQRLRDFQLTISPEETRSELTSILGLVVMASHVQRSLFELNYRELESSFDMVQTDIEITTTVRAFTAIHYTVREQPMRRVDTYRLQHGTEILEFPYTIDYSTVQIDSYQEDITTEYCDSRTE